MVRKWSTDHVDISRIRSVRSLHAYVVKLKPHINKNQIVAIYPHTIADSILFEEYFNDGNCPLKRGIIREDYLVPNQFKWSDHILTYTCNWL